MPEQENKGIGIEVDKESIYGLGWILFSVVAIVFYSMLIYAAGISHGMKLGSKSFYIENYNSDNGFMSEGINPIPEIPMEEPKAKRKRK
jgi:hypothetical protein